MKTLATMPAEEIAGLLERHRRWEQSPSEILVHELFGQILTIANQFVPSESGSVLIDDPFIKVDSSESSDNELVFVACFGDAAEQLLGRKIRADRGIVGRTYVSGKPFITSDVSRDKDFYSKFDQETDYQTQSVVAVPIKIGRSTCGVLELINRKRKGAFEKSELALLEIFAGYISTSLQNVLDAERYRELAKRDDLTGLYNDRHFHRCLSEEVESSETHGTELGLIFLDLDHFKSVNDTHGHLVGSQTLREVGLIIARTVENERASCARYGGDEFVIVVPGYGLQQTLQLAEQIREGIGSAIFRIDQGTDTGVMLRPGAITSSIGVASYCDMRFGDAVKMRDRKNEFIRAADQSMYRAKADGKDRVCHGVYRSGAALGS